MKLKRFLSVFLALVMVFALLPVTAMPAKAEDIDVSGDCGDCTWNLQGSTLTISCSAGNGTMAAYDDFESAPWGNYTVYTVVIDGSVSSIGANAFAGCSSLRNVLIRDGVKSIGYRSFYSCSGLDQVEIPSSVSIVGFEAFGGGLSLFPA